MADLLPVLGGLRRGMQAALAQAAGQAGKAASDLDLSLPAPSSSAQ